MALRDPYSFNAGSNQMVVWLKLNGALLISIKARSCDMRYSVGSSAQVANATTSHFIEAGERLDIAVPLNANIAVIRDTAATANGTLCITELS